MSVCLTATHGRDKRQLVAGLKRMVHFYCVTVQRCQPYFASPQTKRRDHIGDGGAVGYFKCDGFESCASAQLSLELYRDIHTLSIHELRL